MDRRRLALALALAAATAPSAHAQRSYAMRFECRTAESNTPASRRRAEEWVRDKLKAFVPSPEQALRMRTLELEAEQVKLAFYGISTTCEQFLRGTMPRNDADNSLHGFEQTIANFLHDVSSETVVVADRAQVADLGAIRKSLTEIGGIGRQAALLGEEALAEEARKQMVQTLVRFSQAFVERTCWDQVFDDQLPLNVHRQNEVMGTDIDVRPCAQRRFTAVVPPLTFESCTIRGVGEWRVLWDMTAPGATGGTGSGELEQERDAAKGDYKVEWGANGAEYRASGDLELARHDNHPGNKATYTLSGEMDIRLTKGEEMVRMMARLMNQKVGGKRQFRVEPEVSEKPCRSLD
jgi:hypothetical protein